MCRRAAWWHQGGRWCAFQVLGLSLFCTAMSWQKALALHMAPSSSALAIWQVLHPVRAQCWEQAAGPALLALRGGGGGTWAEALAAAEYYEQEASVTEMSTATLLGCDAGWQVRVSCSGICQCPAEPDNPCQGYCTLHCKHSLKTSLQSCS